MRSEQMGCLLIGEEETRMGKMARALEEKNAATCIVTDGKDLLLRAQEGLCRVRPGSQSVCIAAEGAMWPVALALSIQLGVDKIALIDPRLSANHSEDGLNRQRERLIAYARRNLFFCVSEVLIVGEGEADARARRKMEKVWRKMNNARLYRMDKTWINCEQLLNSALISFFTKGEFAKLLAK